MHARLALLPLAFALLACEPPPKHRTWSKLTPSLSDDGDWSRLTREEIEQMRARALAERDPVYLGHYAKQLARFSWEVGEILDARDRAASDPEYKYTAPAGLADLDLQAYIDELEQLIAEREAERGYAPGLELLLHFMRRDCEWVSERVAIAATCHSGPSPEAFEYVYGTCGEYTSLCRKIYDQIIDPRLKVTLMRKCNEVIAHDSESLTALAQWATPEEIEFFKAEQLRGKQEINQLAVQSAMVQNGIDQENERRIEQYQQDRADYEADRGAIEDQSQIGALDGSDRPPAPPEMVSGGMKIADPTSSYAGPNDTITVTFESECKQKLQYVLGDSLNVKWHVGGDLVRGKPVTIEVPRCSSVSLYTLPDPDTGRPTALNASIDAWEVQSFRLLEDCETMVPERPAYAKKSPRPEPQDGDGPPPPPE